MVTQHGIQLATYIIYSFYGDLCSKVCECLLRRGTLTLANLVLFTELTEESVANCIGVLVHQNCVQAFDIQQEGGYGVAPRIVTQYMVLFDNIIHKLRTPTFMQIVSELLGNDCLDIFQDLIQHGSLSFDQIIDTGTSNVDVRESFNKLLNFRFIERCPAPEPFLPPPSEDEQPAKKRGAKSKNAEVPKPTEQRALLAAAPINLMDPMEMDDISEEQKLDAEVPKTTKQRALLAKVPMDSMEMDVLFEEKKMNTEVPRTTEQRAFLDAAPMDSMEMNDLFEEKIEENPISTTPGVKRKRYASASEEEILGVNEKKEVMWRVNFEQLIRRLRHKACILYVKRRFNDEAGIVLSALLELNKSSETKQKTKMSAYVTLNAIYNEAIKKDGGVRMDFDSIKLSLEKLGCQRIESDLDESYRVDLEGIIKMAQCEEVESVIMKKYGWEAFRILRILWMACRVLETDTISDTTVVEKNDTLKILNELCKENYVYMVKASVTTIAGGQQVTHLYWGIKKESLRVKILDDMYHDVLNLILRTTHEREQGKEILQYPREKLDGEVENKYKLLGKDIAILENSLMNLDEAIMLFHDF